MGKAMGKVWVVLLLCLFLSGCNAVRQQPVHPVVTAITITVEDGAQQEVLSFDTDEETSMVLTYLRMLRSGAPAPVNPVYVSGPMYTFSLQYSNGACQTLQQKGEGYFKGSDGIWKTIDSSSKAGLGRLLTRES